jgi:hypothetical protein
MRRIGFAGTNRRAQRYGRQMHWRSVGRTALRIVDVAFNRRLSSGIACPINALVISTKGQRSECNSFDDLGEYSASQRTLFKFPMRIRRILRSSVVDEPDPIRFDSTEQFTLFDVRENIKRELQALFERGLDQMSSFWTILPITDCPRSGCHSTVCSWKLSVFRDLIPKNHHTLPSSCKSRYRLQDDAESLSKIEN